MTRDETKVVQQYLNDNGANLKVDGWWGEKTKKAFHEYVMSKGYIAVLDKVEIVPKNDEIVSTSEEMISEPKTAHFCLAEFRCKDGTKVPKELWINVFKLMNKLEELRAELCRVYGGRRAIHIMSGYRPICYNRKVGSSDSSQHVLSKASDIIVEGLTPKQVYVVADKIFANGGVGIYGAFVHVDIRDGKSRWDER